VACRTGTADAVGRIPPWKIADPGAGAGEDGLNLRRTTPKSPVRVTSGQTRLLPADGPLGVISAPRNSHGLPESRSREFSSYDPKAA
jgi:hypothetical protein